MTVLWDLSYFYAELGDIKINRYMKVGEISLEADARKDFTLEFDMKLTFLFAAKVPARMTIEERYEGDKQLFDIFASERRFQSLVCHLLSWSMPPLILLI